MVWTPIWPCDWIVLSNKGCLIQIKSDCNWSSGFFLEFVKTNKRKEKGQYYTIIDFNEVDIRIYLPEKVNITFKRDGNPDDYYV